MTETPKSAILNSGPGFRIHGAVNATDPALVAGLSAFTTPDISDMLNRLYTMHMSIHNLTSDTTLFGAACTVKVYPGDNLMVHKALDIARPGDVIVVDAGSSSMNGIIGDLITTKAAHRGVAGFVIDGLIRDLPEVRDTGMPVFARGVTPIGPLHRGPGEINFPVSCGGIVVNPGDVICGDENGVVVVRQDLAEGVIANLNAQKESLQKYEADVRRGDFSNAWVDDLLKSLGCTWTE